MSKEKNMLKLASGEGFSALFVDWLYCCSDISILFNR